MKIASLLLLLFVVTTTSSAQEASSSVFNKELMVITENDNYNFTRKDRYYTNGLFIRFNWLGKTTNERIVKTIHRTEAGQMMFNAFYNRRSLEEVEATLDRAFAGWLYGSYGQTKFFSNNDVLLFDATVGVVGPAAFGKQIQTGYHQFINLYSIYGWEYQVQNELGVNASVQYYKSLLNQQPGTVFSLHAVGKAMLGNTFTNASTGLLFKFGYMEPQENSSYWSGRLGQSKTKQKVESYLFLEPLLMAQGYNATVQGGLLRKDKGLYTSTLNPLMYLIKTGIVLSNQKIAFSATYTFKEREASTMIKPMEWYGAFGVAVRFR